MRNPRVVNSLIPRNHARWFSEMLEEFAETERERKTHTLAAILEGSPHFL